VHWSVRLNELENQKSINTTDLTFHKCSEVDYNSFAPPAKASEKAISNMKAINLSLYCLDEG
jgi:hypothetical protein